MIVLFIPVGVFGGVGLLLLLVNAFINSDVYGPYLASTDTKADGWAIFRYCLRHPFRSADTDQLRDVLQLRRDKRSPFWTEIQEHRALLKQLKGVPGDTAEAQRRELQIGLTELRKATKQRIMEAGDDQAASLAHDLERVAAFRRLALDSLTSAKTPDPLDELDEAPAATPPVLDKF